MGKIGKNPSGRNREQLQNHFEVEKRLADGLLAAPRSERTDYLKKMYDELFIQVPDHPRLKYQKDPLHDTLLSFLRKFVSGKEVFVEFGPGDCNMIASISPIVKKAYGVDVSNQTLSEIPENLKHITYDGYNLDLPDAIADVVYSNQLIEHLHPDDVNNHFELVNRILKRKGRYILITPHRFSGPHDVSKYFSTYPAGFHVNETTYQHVRQILSSTGFTRIRGYWTMRFHLRVPFYCLIWTEKLLARLTYGLRNKLARILIPSIVIVADKI